MNCKNIIIFLFIILIISIYLYIRVIKISYLRSNLNKKTLFDPIIIEGGKSDKLKEFVNLFKEIMNDLNENENDIVIKYGGKHKSLQDEYNKIMKDNKHITQKQWYTDIDERNVKIIPISKLERILSDTANTKTYKRRTNEKKTVNHWGQRKLLLSEIEFLTLYTEPDTKYTHFLKKSEQKYTTTVVYAGAAPGTHTEYLASLFPMIKFVLVDPSNFIAKSGAQIEIRQSFFTDEIAKEFADKPNVLFISDIRSADWKVMNEEEVEQTVENDQIMQMKWVLLMNPIASMLKFRLPWGSGTTQYLEGKIYLPIWGPQTTTETRLMVERGAKIIKYDHKKYEEQMFYFNVETRVNLYNRKPGLIESIGLCRCYDCSAEIHVIIEYYLKYNKLDKDKIYKYVSTFIDGLANKCSPHSGRTLASVISPTEHKWFKGREFDTKNQKITDVSDEIVSNELKNKKKKTTFERKSRSFNIEQNKTLADLIK